MYLLWTPEPAAPGDTEQLLHELAPQLLALGPSGLTIDADDTNAQVPSPLPLPDDEPPVRAVVSIWLDAYDRREPFEALLRAQLPLRRLPRDRIDVHRLRRQPVVGPRDWPDGQRSPVSSP